MHPEENTNESGIQANSRNGKELMKRNEKVELLHSKVFLQRSSPLYQILENDSSKIVYVLFLMVYLILLLHTFLYDYIKFGTINIGQRNIIFAFAKFDVMLMVWFLTFIIHLTPYVGLNVWMAIRMRTDPGSHPGKLIDNISIVLYAIWIVLFQMFLPAYLVIKKDLGVISSGIMGIEMCRMAMKTYSFIKENVAKVASYKPHSDLQEPTIPHINKLIYFSFAPTLLYRDTYPKTSIIRWTFVFKCFTEFATAIHFCSLICDLYVQQMESVCVVPLFWHDLILMIIKNTLFGSLIMFVFFFLVLHTWMNGFAEMTRFADRLFYEDWWNSWSFKRFYVTWNVMTSEWLRIYILHDLIKYVEKKQRFTKGLAFFISAFLHEYTFILMARFIFPVFFVLFFCGGVMYLYVGEPEKGLLGSLYVHILMGFGVSVMINLYTIEYLARTYYPLDADNFFTIRFLTCGKCFI